MTPAQMKLIVAGVALVLAGVAGHHLGASGVQAEWDRDKLARSQAQARAVTEAVAANEKARQADLKVTRQILSEYVEKLNEANDRITFERADADRDRLRIAIPARVCAAAASTGRADASPSVETIELPEAVERRLRDLAERADREVASLEAKVLALQGWIRKHGFYEVGSPAAD